MFEFHGNWKFSWRSALRAIFIAGNLNVEQYGIVTILYDCMMSDSNRKGLICVRHKRFRYVRLAWKPNGHNRWVRFMRLESIFISIRRFIIWIFVKITFRFDQLLELFMRMDGL